MPGGPRFFVLLVLVICGGVFSDVAWAGEKTPPCQRPEQWLPEGSLDRLVDDLVCRLDQRMASRFSEEGKKETLRLSLHGLSARSRKTTGAWAVFQWRLGQAAAFTLNPKASRELSITVSERRGQVRVKAEVLGHAPSIPFVVVVEQSLDTELEEALGLAPSSAQTGRILRQSLATLSDLVLDLVLMDLDDANGDEVVVLFPDGVQGFHLDPSQGALLPLGERIPLQARGERKKNWPALMTGWIAEVGAKEVILATSAGHVLTMNLKTGARQIQGSNAAPLRQVGRVGEDNFILLKTQKGSATLVGPPLAPNGMAVPAGKLSTALAKSGVRDLVSWPEKNLWLWVDEYGRLVQHSTFTRFSLPDEPVGDRFVVADLDGDGLFDLITTGAKKPEDADQLAIYPLEASAAQKRRPLRIALRPAGSILALSAGDLDGDGATDLVVVQATHDAGGRMGQVQVWRLEGSR
jgi:hypothetical protein